MAATSISTARSEHEAARRGMFAGRLPFLRRAVCLVATALSLVLTPDAAMRVNDAQRIATLDRAEQGRLPAGPCKVPADSTVEMIAEVAGPATAIDLGWISAPRRIRCATSAIRRHWLDHRADDQPLTMRPSERCDRLKTVMR